MSAEIKIVNLQPINASTSMFNVFCFLAFGILVIISTFEPACTAFGASITFAIPGSSPTVPNSPSWSGTSATSNAAVSDELSSKLV